jgi:hypothetical protein
MSTPDYTSLTAELEKNEQICLSLKGLIDCSCTQETLSVLAEELCDKAEHLKNRYGTFIFDKEGC